MTATSTLSRLERLELAARGIVEGHLAGRHRSPRRGVAIEFAQHRDYTPGDDLRHLDWKVFARREQDHIKQFEQETNLTLWLIVDVSASMQFGTKFDTAATAAAALAMLAQRQQDAVGLVTISDRVESLLKPSTRPSQVRDVLRTLADGPGERTTEVGTCLENLAGRLGRRGVVMVFSDFLDEVPPVAEALKHLKFHKHDVVLMQTLDAAEVDFPFHEPTKFEGLEDPSTVSTDPASVRAEYQSKLNGHLATLIQTCRTLATDRVLLRSDADVGAILSEMLQRRM